MIELRYYQRPVVERAAQILYDKGIVLMAAECRTGKTISSLFVAHNTGSKGVLFVTPKKAIPSVQRDYDMMQKDNPYLFYINIINPESILAAFKKAEKTATDIIKSKYPAVSMTGVKFKRLVSEEKENQLSILFPFTFDTIIVDECHRQGSHPRPCGSQQCLKHLAKGKRIILLSGTPNPESHSMFYHEFDISEHSPWSQYKNFYAWAKDYVNVTQKMVNGFNVPDYNDGKKDLILRDISDYTVTLTQQEAGFETAIDERVIRVNMQPHTDNLIKSLKSLRAINVEQIQYLFAPSDGKDAPAPSYIVAETAADLLNKIHQLSGGTIKLGDYYYIIDRTKAEYLRDTFAGKHYAVFYSYKAERDLLRAVLGPRVTESPEEFQEDPTSIFIGQIRSVREGVKLSTADFSVFYSMEYSYVSYAQGRQRIVDKDRKDPSIVYFMVSQCRIEQLILNCVHNKKDFTLSVYTHNN